MKPLVVSLRTTSPLGGSGQSLSVWLNALAVVQRPTRIVHIGIGDGKGESCVWTDWPLTKALAIDADPQTQEVIEVQSHVIGETEGRVAYFVASNPSENGLIDPSLLRMVWPSLTLSHQVQRDSSTLDRAAAEMLDTAIDVGAEPLWLIVDALPAVSILSGGTKLLDVSSLVCVRALAEAGFRGEPAGADLAAVDRFLEEKGFIRVIYLPGLNPKVGHALYARKRSIQVKSPIESEASLQLSQVQQAAEALTVSLQQTSESLQATQAKLDVTLQERDAAQAAAEATFQERDSVRASSAALGAQLHEQTQEKEQALQQLEEAKQSTHALTASLQQSAEGLKATQAKLDATLQERDAARATLDVTLKERDAAQATSAALGAQLHEQTQEKEQALQQLEEAKQSMHALTASLQQSAEGLKATQAKLDVTLQERDASRATSAALDLQLQEQIEVKDVALNELAEINKSAEALTACLLKASEDQQVLQAKLDTTQLERDTVQASSAALGAQLKEQTQAKEQALHQLADMRQSCDALTATLKAKEIALESELLQVQRLTAENNELTHRQKLMNEELVKAEGQITLIKDLLLREQGL
ncbi:hypothetical protein KZZ10_10325 [Alcaligenaceae bacterium LF4-65]|uniref:Uncharacterized protein n=1 Tax=Zwartia hollandica TaxID=324606 RepID=A0A953N8Z9_9BURK|nr:hypothetical protein [Zwartia hollandica]MBZ1351041.1 hypothetical protein [Zwartia hollandica]